MFSVQWKFIFWLLFGQIPCVNQFHNCGPQQYSSSSQSAMDWCRVPILSPGYVAVFTLAEDRTAFVLKIYSRTSTKTR